MPTRRTAAPRGGATHHHDEHRSILDRVGDIIANSAAYVAHEVMPDIGAKLVDEAWFERRPAQGVASFAPPKHSEGQSAGNFREADPGPSAEQDVTHDHDR